MVDRARRVVVVDDDEELRELVVQLVFRDSNPSGSGAPEESPGHV